MTGRTTLIFAFKSEVSRVCFDCCNFSLKTGHNFSWVWQDTQCDVNTAMAITADWWKQGMLAIIGPGCTCDYEARMASALKLPMIDYVSRPIIGRPFS